MRKNIFKILAFFTFFYFFIFGQAAQSQEILKHPRVVELEDILKNSASEYIKARFPSAPFMVQVRVDPLRRDLSYSGKAESERELPFYSDDQEDEIRDEWDNPQYPINALLNRVKRIRVDISIPSQLKESEVAELKAGIFQVLHLTPARDEIDISKRDWALNEIPWFTIYICLGVLFTFLTGLLLINRASTNRLAKALQNVKIDGQQSRGNVGAATFKSTESDVSQKGQSQELKFNDPLRMKELAAKHVQYLSSVEFPNHHDMFALDSLGKKSPERLGAVLVEFPAEVQKKVFSFSKEFYWVQALNKPGFLDFECLETLQALSQNLRSPEDATWGKTVIAVWRLGFQINDFLKKNLIKEEAFAVLNEMPKSIGVSTARKTFPGSWADILNPNLKTIRPKKDRTEQIFNLATQLVPLSDLNVVSRYRDEVELLNFLKLVDPAEERDIYGAAPSSSIIHSQRYPFFPVFDLDIESMKDFVVTVPFEMWAYALFNVAKSERSKIDSHFSDKQKFLLIEKFKMFDANPPDAHQIGQYRETIGSMLHKWLIEKALLASDQTIADVSLGENEDGNQRNAA